MPTRKIDTKLSVSGEKEYRQSISAIDQDLKVLGSEMKLATAKFRDNEESVEALTAKNDILSKKFDTQEKKVAELRKALENAVSAYGENDKRTKEWQRSLNEAEAELKNVNRDLKQYGEALKRVSNEENVSGGAFARFEKHISGVLDESNELGDAVGDLAGKFGVDLPDGLRNSLNGMGRVNPVFLAGAGAVAALATAVVEAEKALMNITREASAAADEILTLSEQTRVAAEDLQAFAYASDFIDVSVDALQDGLKETTMRIKEVSEGSEEVSNLFVRLGVSARDSSGEMRDADAVFYDLVDSLGRIQNQTERDAIAMELFGESASQLNPLIDRGSDSLKKYAQEAEELGYVLDEKALEALHDVDDAQQKLLKTQEAVTKQIASQYAPSMEEALGDTAEFINDVGDALTKSGAVKSFGDILKTATQLLEPLGELAEDTLPALDLGLQVVAQTLAWISDTAKVIVGIMPWNWGSGLLSEGLGLGIYSGKLSAQQQQMYGDSGWAYNPVTGKWEGNVYSGNASGTHNWRGGWTWVGENGPELMRLPRGTQIQTAQESRSSGGDVYNITIDAKSVKEFEDVVRIVKNQRRTLRMEGVS